MTARLLLIAALTTCAAGLSGCGLQGDLERPAPLYGQNAREAYAREQARKETLGADGNAQPNASGEDNAGDATDSMRPFEDTRETTPLPPRTAPIGGQSPDPFRSGPSGALPDPYNNPNRSQ